MTQGRSRMNIVNKYYPSVTRIVDARKNATFQVTERDSRRSNPLAPDACALAEVCKKTYDGAIISMSTAYLIKGNTATRYEVPVRIARELVSFDRHHDFAPGEYTLKAPAPSFRIGSDKRKRRILLEPKTRILGPTKHKFRTQGIRAL